MGEVSGENFFSSFFCKSLSIGGEPGKARIALKERPKRICSFSLFLFSLDPTREQTQLDCLEMFPCQKEPFE
jgi:hypothetical protein